MSFIKMKPLFAAWIVLIIATGIEISQYFKVLDKLDLGNNPLLRVIFGTTFSYGDLIAYTFGVMAVLIIEKTFFKTEG